MKGRRKGYIAGLGRRHMGKVTQSWRSMGHGCDGSHVGRQRGVAQSSVLRHGGINGRGEGKDFSCMAQNYGSEKREWVAAAWHSCGGGGGGGCGSRSIESHAAQVTW